MLGDLDHELDEDVLIAGDSKEAKAAVAELIRRIAGLRPVNAGRLEQARHIEALTPLLISVNINNKTHAGDPAHRPAGAPLVALLSGGTGGAKLARGLLDARRARRWSPTPATTWRSTASTSRPTPTS